jgi:hypothetical protein
LVSVLKSCEPAGVGLTALVPTDAEGGNFAGQAAIRNINDPLTGRPMTDAAGSRAWRATLSRRAVS